MKILFALALVSSILLMSCANETYISEKPHHVRVYGADFTKYTALGFQITPESYLGQYESIALLNMDFFPAVCRLNFSDTNQNFRTGYNEYFVNGQSYFVENISLSDALDSLYTLATKLGANSIVKFKIDVLSREDGPLNTDGFQISGFAIRKLKNNSRVLTD